MKLVAASTCLAVVPAVAFVTPRTTQLVNPASLKSSDSAAIDTNDRETIEKRNIYDPMGLYPQDSIERTEGRIRNMENDLFQMRTTAIDEGAKTRKIRPLYDPLNLYPKDAPERKAGLIQPLEASFVQTKVIRDPLGLYPENVVTDNDIETDYDMQVKAATNSNRIYDPLGLYPADSIERKDGRIRDIENDLFPSMSVSDSESIGNRPLFDPLRLYPEDAPERKQGRIQPLETSMEQTNEILDPLNLYPKNVETDDAAVDKSVALPFMARPAMLTGDLPGDVGFDPLGFASSEEKLLSLREAEIKHSRLAMLAAVGWPISELWDKQLALMTHLKPLLGDGDRVPSILNGGLEKVSPAYWAIVLAAASCIEIFGGLRQEKGSEYIPGNLSFDPLGLYPKNKNEQQKMQLAEIKHGRLAMLAITSFALQEFVTNMGVVNQTPFFFHPFH